MSRRLCIVLVLLLVAVVPSSSMAPPKPDRMYWPDRSSLTVMTLNVRTSLAPEDGINGWIYRRSLVAHVLREEAPDVIALQEADPWQISGIQAAVPGYASVTTKLGNQWRGYPSILYRKDRFVLKSSERLWLSAVPTMVDSVSWGNPSPRCYTSVRLKDKVSGKSFVFVSTHFDYQSPYARLESASQLASWASRQGSTPVILAGDFNEVVGSTVLDPITSRLEDSYIAVHQPERGTLHGFTGQANCRVDMIFVSTNWRPTSSHVISYHEGEVYPSDHYPVVATLDFPIVPSSMIVLKPVHYEPKAP